jgi:hypothetical protein
MKLLLDRNWCFCCWLPRCACRCLPLHLWLRATYDAPADAERIAGERRRYLRILAVSLGSAAALLGALMWRLALLFDR